MPRQLNVRSDRAYEAANRLSRRLGVSTTEVVERALETLDRKTYRPITYADLNEEERAWVDGVMEKARAVRATLPEGVTSDHSDMYDENGLPK